jgi:hypothetical protein
VASTDLTHGASPKALKNLPADVGLFSFSEERLRLEHLDSRWITTSDKSSDRAYAPSGKAVAKP